MVREFVAYQSKVGSDMLLFSDVLRHLNIVNVNVETRHLTYINDVTGRSNKHQHRKR